MLLRSSCTIKLENVSSAPKLTVVSEHALLRVEGISDPKTTKPIDQDSIHPSNKPDVSCLPKKNKK